jgi:membrane protease YdiL (CAAX protease family)
MRSKSETGAARARGVDWPIVAFFVLAYAIAWGGWLVLGAIARQSGVDDTAAFLAQAEALQFEGVALAAPGWAVYLLTRLLDFAFSISGMIMIAFTSGAAGLRLLGRRLLRWRIGLRWYALGLLPLLLYLVAALVAGAAPVFTSDTLPRILFSAEAGLLVSLFLRGAFGEELGLRGFALPRLQTTMTPFRASLVIGLLWGLWHLPVLLGRDTVSLVAFLLLSFGLAFIFTWLFDGSGGSLIPGLLFHATQNWEEGFETVFPALAGSDWELLSTLALLVVGMVAAVVVWRRGARWQQEKGADIVGT